MYQGCGFLYMISGCTEIAYGAIAAAGLISHFVSEREGGEELVLRCRPEEEGEKEKEKEEREQSTLMVAVRSVSSSSFSS
eukprot:2217486-Rhodomonas_salina.1